MNKQQQRNISFKITLNLFLTFHIALFLGYPSLFVSHMNNLFPTSTNILHLTPS